MELIWYREFGDSSDTGRVEQSSALDTSSVPTTGERAGPASIGERTKALLEEHASDVTLDDLMAVNEPGSSHLQWADLDRATTGAIELLAHHYASNCEPGPDPERYRREVGGDIVTGYLIGRRLLGTHGGALIYSRNREESDNAFALGYRAADLLEHGVAELPDAITTYIDRYAEYHSTVGEYALITDRRAAQTNLVQALWYGLMVALAEQDLFG